MPVTSKGFTQSAYWKEKAADLQIALTNAEEDCERLTEEIVKANERIASLENALANDGDEERFAKF